MQIYTPPLQRGIEQALYSWFINVAATVNQMFVPVPATSSSTGEPNQFSYDTNYLYICVAPNKWLRIAIATW